MSLKKEDYKPRLIDKKIKNYLHVFGAVSIEGPKWCGKTYTSLNHANDVIFLDDSITLNRAQMDFNLLLSKFNKKPLLIDEWNLYPETWDKIRRKCDETQKNGNYILTCSTKLEDETFKEKIKHSGAGRIGKVKMNTMTLYETKDSSGNVSLMDLYNNKFKHGINTEINLEKLAYYIVRGGWPRNINVDAKYANIIPDSYIKKILEVDINQDKKRSQIKMEMLLKSLARNETTVVKKSTIIKDIFDNEEEKIQSRITLNDYLDVLKRLNILKETQSYRSNYRSKERVGKSAKMHLTDVSLSCALLNVNISKLLEDPNIFGLLFEGLVEHDLEVYMDYLNGRIYHFKDNVTGLEIDTILEFENGDYAAVEIKLTENGIEEAKKNLIKFKENMEVTPKFMAIIVGNTDMILKDEETGIFIIPITALKP